VAFLSSEGSDGIECGLLVAAGGNAGFSGDALAGFRHTDGAGEPATPRGLPAGALTFPLLVPAREIIPDNPSRGCDRAASGDVSVSLICSLRCGGWRIGGVAATVAVDGAWTDADFDGTPVEPGDEKSTFACPPIGVGPGWVTLPA